jgi:hypothetical protein
MILKIFLPKNLAKILVVFVQTTASFCKNFIITLVFEKYAVRKVMRNNLAKIAEILITTSTPVAGIASILKGDLVTGGYISPGSGIIRTPTPTHMKSKLYSEPYSVSSQMSTSRI